MSRSWGGIDEPWYEREGTQHAKLRAGGDGMCRVPIHGPHDTHGTSMFHDANIDILTPMPTG
jgi:hypothetical protein